MKLTIKKELLALLIIVSVFGGWALSTTNTWQAPMLGDMDAVTLTGEPSQTPPQGEGPKTYMFLCLQNKTISATFHDESDRVHLVLKDAKTNTTTTLTLSRTMSASGAKYATNNNRLIFWQKGNSAFVEDQEEITYRDCMTSGLAN